MKIKVDSFYIHLKVLYKMQRYKDLCIYVYIYIEYRQIEVFECMSLNLKCWNWKDDSFVNIRNAVNVTLDITVLVHILSKGAWLFSLEQFQRAITCF